MSRGQIDFVQVFEVVLAGLLLLTTYGWYLMFGEIIAVAYGVVITGMLLMYFHVTYGY